MKIQIKIGDLIEQITQAAITTDHKAPDTAAGKVYLRAKKQPSKEDASVMKHFLYFFSTNQASKTFIKIEIKEVEEEGQILIDYKKLLGGLQGRDPEQIVEITSISEENKIKVQVGKNVMNLLLNVNIDNAVAVIKTLPTGSSVAKIAAKTLISFIKRSLFCIQRDDNGQQRFALGVLNIKSNEDSYIAQATDGNIVAWHKALQDSTVKYKIDSLLIPIDALSPLQRLLQKHNTADVEILEGNRTSKGELQEVFFRMEGVLFGTVLRTGAYPDIEFLLEQHSPLYVVDVNKEALKNTLIRSMSFVESIDSKRGVKLTALAETLNVEATDSVSNLNDELTIKINKGTFKPITVTVNIDYLANIVSSQTSDVISLGFNNDKAKAVTLSDESDANLSTRYAIMPIVTEKKIKVPKKVQPVEEIANA